MKNSKKLPVSLLIALVGFGQLSETIYTPALPSLAQGLQTSAYMAEATLAIYFVGFALGVLLWGTISDRCGRKATMLCGLVIYSVATFCCAHSMSIQALLVWRFMQAFGISVGSVITQTILRDCCDGAERTRLFAIISGALAFSPAIGPLLGGCIAQFFLWRANFWVLWLFSLVLLLWTVLCLKETRPKHIARPQMGTLFFNMMSSRNLWGHILLIASTNGILFGFYQEGPFVFIEQLGVEPTHYGLFGLLIAGSTFVAARISYRQKVDAHSQIFRGALFILIGSLLLTMTILTRLFDVHEIVVSLLPLSCIFFGIGLIIPNSLSHALKPYHEAIGTAGSIFGGLYYCLIALCTLLMSTLHNGGPLPLALYMTFLGVVAVIGSKGVRPVDCPDLIAIKSRQSQDPAS